MKINPCWKDFKNNWQENNLIVFSYKFYSDFLTPTSIYFSLRKIFPKESFLLESVEGDEKISRYSFIGFEPICVFRAKDKNFFIEERGRVKKGVINGTPFQYLKDLMSKYKVWPKENIRFWGGFVGYVGYDCVRFFEPVGEFKKNALNVDEFYFILPKYLIIYDHIGKEIEILSFLYKEDSYKVNLQNLYQKEEDRIKKIVELICKREEADILHIPYIKDEDLKKLKFKSNFSFKKFKQAVEKAIDYIKEGEIIQVVLSQRIKVPFKKDPFLVYRYLRLLNPSAYMFYLDFKNAKIVGSSPEMLVRCEKGVVTTRPIAGTRRRGYDEEEDKRLEKDLLDDTKEKAEHLMLLDLGRNDLGRVCKKGTVGVSVFMRLERFSHVMHLVSEVQGILDDSYDMFDVLKACFPAGTVSGAPKVRAMQIINELEPTRRNIYAGSVGYFSFTGDMDMGIIIRTIIFIDQYAYVQAGAGIVYDSIPEREYKETINKAQAQLLALMMADNKI